VVKIGTYSNIVKFRGAPNVRQREHMACFVRTDRPNIVIVAIAIRTRVGREVIVLDVEADVGLKQVVLHPGSRQSPPACVGHGPVREITRVLPQSS